LDKWDAPDYMQSSLAPRIRTPVKKKEKTVKKKKKSAEKKVSRQSAVWRIVRWVRCEVCEVDVKEVVGVDSVVHTKPPVTLGN
jgi:hypothetical protein